MVAEIIFKIAIGVEKCEEIWVFSGHRVGAGAILGYCLVGADIVVCCARIAFVSPAYFRSCLFVHLWSILRKFSIREKRPGGVRIFCFKLMYGSLSTSFWWSRGPSSLLIFAFSDFLWKFTVGSEKMSPRKRLLPSFTWAASDLEAQTIWRKIIIFPVGPGLRFRGCLCWLGGIYLKVCLGLFIGGRLHISGAALGRGVTESQTGSRFRRPGSVGYFVGWFLSHMGCFWKNAYFQLYLKTEHGKNTRFLP